MAQKKQSLTASLKVVSEAAARPNNFSRGYLETPSPTLLRGSQNPPFTLESPSRGSGWLSLPGAPAWRWWCKGNAK